MELDGITLVLLLYNIEMNNRERFRAVMQYEQVDRISRFEEGIRDEVRQAWESQGLRRGVDLVDFFGYDTREEVEFDLEPHPQSVRWPVDGGGLDRFRESLQADDRRMPRNWKRRLADWRSRPQPLILRLQRGFFLSMGVEGWDGFNEAIALTKDEPALVGEVLRLQGSLSAQLAERFLSRVSVDAALFSEPISSDHGPLISPKMYAELVLPSYQPILDVLRRFQVPVTIMRTYANPRPLVGLFLEAGFNCLWAVEAPPDAMDYRDLRRQYGRDLRLIGGIDTDALRRGKAAIQQALAQAAPLVGDGGYIPLLDGRVRDDVDYSAYLTYRKLLEEII